MRWLSRASLWMLTKRSKGFKETEITAFAVMPSTRSLRPVVTTVTPVGKRLIATRTADASGPRVSQPCFSRSCPSADNAISFVGLPCMSDARRLLRVGSAHKAFSHTKLLRPPALDRLPVGAVPAALHKAVPPAVVEIVEDERGRAR